MNPEEEEPTEISRFLIEATPTEGQATLTKGQATPTERQASPTEGQTTPPGRSAPGDASMGGSEAEGEAATTADDVEQADGQPSEMTSKRPVTPSHWRDVILECVAATLFLVDVITDVTLAAVYLSQGCWLCGGVTLTLVVAAYVTCAVLTAVTVRDVCKMTWVTWVFLAPCLVLNLGPVVL